MRTRDNIYSDYLYWLRDKTGNDKYLPNLYLSKDLDEEEIKLRKASIYKSILELVIDREYGIYYFTRFIIGDLKHIGYPKSYRLNKVMLEWYGLVKNHSKLAIMAHRGSGKSIFFSEMLNIYDMFIKIGRAHV